MQRSWEVTEFDLANDSLRKLPLAISIGHETIRRLKIVIHFLIELILFFHLKKDMVAVGV